MPSQRSTTSGSRATFLLRRLHSLTGVVPAGLFMIVHLSRNSGALLGECRFTEGLIAASSLPYIRFIEIFGIILPIAFHGAIGVWLAVFQSSYNPLSYGYARNWLFAFQRLTGVLLVFFLGWHLSDMVLTELTGQLSLEGLYGHLAQGMSSDMVYLSMFVVGTVAVSFHLGNGLWGFCASWGILQSRRAQRVGAWVFGAVGVVLAVAWINIVFHFAAGGPVGRHNMIPVQEPPVECGAAHLDELTEM